MSEIWCDIKGYEGLYQVSDRGRVKSLTRWDINARKHLPCERTLNPTDNGKGYMIVGLRRDTKRRNYYVHRLVAEAFVPNPDNKTCVNHKDYDVNNNNAYNLEWCSQEENVNYSRDHMMKHKTRSHSNTGEMYITYRRSKNHYRVIINKKEHGSFASLEEAKAHRDAVLEGR